MRPNTIAIALAVAAIGACSKPKTTTVAMNDSLTAAAHPTPLGDTGTRSTTPAETVFVDRTRPPGPPPRRPPPQPRRRAPRTPSRASRRQHLRHRAVPVLPAGTTIAATAIDSVHSRHNRVGDRIRVRVSDDITANGRVVIPAGSVITLAVLEIDNAIERNHKGTLALGVREIDINGVAQPISAGVTNFQYEMKSRGVGAAEVAKTGAGAVVGGIIGNAVGGKVGTIVGAVGAVGGAAVARKTAVYDIVVHAGAPVTLELREGVQEKLKRLLSVGSLVRVSRLSAGPLSAVSA